MNRHEIIRYPLALMRSLLLAVSIFVSGCMEMDSFLNNVQPLEAYTLPGNTIPDSLLTPVELSSEGNKIYGYWVRSNGTGNSGVTILYCHGNKHNIDNYWDRVMMLHDLGVNLFIFDYRGYGRSEGETTEPGLHADAEAALGYVRTRPEFRADSLVLYGYSLGNVASVYLAAHVVTPYRLIAESPFASANSLTQANATLDLPSRWLTEWTFDVATDIKLVKAPFLHFHGEADDFVRYRDNGRVVFEAAPKPKKQVLVPGANHTTIPETMGVEEYLKVIREWIR